MYLANKVILDRINNFEMRSTHAVMASRLNSRIITTSGVAANFESSSTLEPGHIAYLFKLETSILNQTASTNRGCMDDYTPAGHADLIVGSGTTAPTLSDYVLESQITTLEHISVTQEARATENVIIRVFKNTSNSSITVSEVGVVIRLQKYLCDGTVSATIPFLITRNVLSTPITVPANGYFAAVVSLQ